MCLKFGMYFADLRVLGGLQIIMLNDVHWFHECLSGADKSWFGCVPGLIKLDKFRRFDFAYNHCLFFNILVCWEVSKLSF